MPISAADLESVLPVLAGATSAASGDASHSGRSRGVGELLRPVSIYNGSNVAHLVFCLPFREKQIVRLLGSLETRF